jgi:hypothetical protein
MVFPSNRCAVGDDQQIDTLLPVNLADGDGLLGVQIERDQTPERLNAATGGSKRRDDAV